MKAGTKFIDRSTRRTVTVKQTYKEDISGKTVVNYTHHGDRTQVGALYSDDFVKYYRPKPIKLN